MSIEEKIHDYVTKQKRLLELELRSEEDESADQDDEERAGHILRNLRMDHISVGLVGKTVVHFVNGDPNSQILPAHRLSVGDEVEIVQKYKETEDKRGKSQSGAVICQVTDTTIALTMFDDSNSDDTTFDGLVCLVPRSSVEVHKKMVKGLHELQNSGIDHEYCGKVIETIFEPPHECYTPDISVQFEPFNKHLDTSQIEAIRFSLFGAQPIHIIHGPPGTGKTTTVVELIQQAVEKQKLRVLVTAPSNQAVDNILEKLVVNCDPHSKKKLRAVRLGHPARINPSILNYSLEYLVRNSDGTEIVNDIRQELKSFLDKTSSSKTRGMERRSAYREIKSLRKEIREREEKVISSILGNAQIILATNVGAASSMLDRYGKLPFDIVIIDEAAQALEASCWIPTMRGKRLILAGDHCQLPPTIKCKRQDVIKELSRTMFERVMEENKFASRMLQIQYRMHQDISNWSSMAMYSGRLESHHSVKARKLNHLPSINNNYIEPDSVLSITRDATLLLVDTAGSDLFESVNAAGSRYNEGEASIVVKHVENLITLGVKVEDIAVISPYNGQLEILKSLLLKNHPKLEIRSVDGFQGGEREAVVLSLVRSSERSGKDGVGFLRDNRRLNVAVTRAKRQCAVICDSDTISQDKFLKDFVNWIDYHGEYLSAIDYSDHQEEKVLTAADLQMEHLYEREECKSDKVGYGCQAEAMCSDLSTDEVLTKGAHDVITEVKELEDQLFFFAEVTDDENEILQLHLSRSEVLLRCMDSLCRNLSLKSNMVSGNTETGLFSFSKCPVLSRNIESSPNFDKIKTDLNVFARSAEVDEYYDFTMTSDINIFELKALCKQLKLKYESVPGKFIVQIDKEANASPSVLEDTFTPKHIMSGDNVLHSKSDINSEELQMMKSETTEKSACPIAAKGTTVEPIETNPIDDKKKLDITGGETNFRMNDLLGSLARERNSRINATQQQPLSSKTKSKSKGKNKGKRPTTKAAKNEESDDIDDMAFLDSQIDKVMNSHGRTIEGNGKNFRTIINGNLLPKSKTKETKTRDPRQADALARKLKEAKIARSAKQKK